MARLLTVLGTGNYRPASYYLAADPSRTHETRYAPAATAALGGPVADAAVLVTAEARAMHWEGCRDALAALGVPARALEIPAGTTEREIWQVFEAILEAAAGQEEVVLDVTYSFRHLPFVLLASLTYLTALERTTIRGIYYGAYEAGGGGRAPLVDLAPLLTLADWYHAVRTFGDTGSPGRLAEALRGAARQLVERLGPEPALNSLRRTLEGLAWSLPAGLPLEAGLEAMRGLAAIEVLLAAPSRAPMVNTVLEPLRKVLKLMALPVVVSEKTGVALDRAELARQLRLARAYQERGQTDRALLLLREWMINRCLLARGEVGPGWLNYAGARRPTEQALNGLAQRARYRRQDPAEVLGKLWARVADARNEVAHCGFRQEEVRDRRQQVCGLIEECEALSAEDQVWRTAAPGPLGRLLVTPLGLSPGVLFTALRSLRPDAVLVITSREAAPLVGEACARAAWAGAPPERHLVADPHRCFDEVTRIVAWARPFLLDAAEVLVNVTGGTTAMQYLVERVAGEAARLGVPATRYALLDRRSPEEQRRDPYVLGERVALRGDEPAGGE